MRALINRVVYQAALGAALLMLASGISCGGGDSSGPGDTNITDFITRVDAAGGTIAAHHSNLEPPASEAGPVATVTGTGNVINGGSALLSISGSGPFSQVFLTVAGYRGYFWVPLPAPVTSVDLQVTLGRDLPDQAFDIEVGIAEFSHPGPLTTHALTVVPAGTGQVQVSVTWNAASDVDLHVVEPGGEEIFYGHKGSAAGGVLDLDSNADCVLDNVNNENITWDSDAPHGTSTVRVDYYKSCGVASTDFAVTIQRRSMTPEVFRGSFTGGGDQGGAGSGSTIVTFTY